VRTGKAAVEALAELGAGMRGGQGVPALEEQRSENTGTL
jgi:hypothetical protein